MQTSPIRFIAQWIIPLILLLALSACARLPVPLAKATASTAAPPAETTQGSAAQKNRAPETPAPEDLTALSLPAQAFPAVAWSAPPECPAPPCPALVIAQEGRLARADWSAQGFRAAPPASPGPLEGARFVIDTGQPSPDGQWAAFTTLGYETGGPVLLQETASGRWTDLIAEVNKRLPAGETPLPANLLWDVIGWFPDSARLLVGPGDLSMVMLVDIRSFTAKIIPFDGGGKGGRMFVALAPDGSQFFYVGESAAGEQSLSAYNFQDEKVTEIAQVPYQQGAVRQPRFSPDGASIAYITQNFAGGSASGSLELLPAAGGAPRTLARGQLAAAIPAWSPDGRRIAFTRDDAPQAAIAAEGAAPAPLRGNLWVVEIASGEETQLTHFDGLARSPAWAADGQTLAFVTHDGQVGMVRPEQPGAIWQAAGPAAAFPELTTFFFLPQPAEAQP